MNLGRQALGNKADDEADDDSQANIKKKFDRFEIGAIGKTTLFPEEEREPGPADVIGAVGEAQHSGKAAIGLEVSSEKIDYKEQVERDEAGKSEDEAGFSGHKVMVEALFQKPLAEQGGLGEADGLQIRLRAAVLSVEVIEHSFHVILYH